MEAVPARENWKPVPDFETVYEASDRGRVRSVRYIDARGRVRKSRLMEPIVHTNGYPCVRLTKARKRIRRSVHQLVLEAFVGPKPENQCARHLDGNPLNNQLSNLKWGTYSENAKDCVKHRGMMGARKRKEFEGASPEETARENMKLAEAIPCDPDQEVWLPVPGYEATYEVSSFGRVKSLDKQIVNSLGVARKYKGKVLVPLPTKRRMWYHRVNLYSNTKLKSFSVHRLVVIAFLGDKTKEGKEVSHQDGNPLNNHLYNLKWETHAENTKRRNEHGSLMSGENHTHSVYTEKEIREVFRMHKEDNLSFRRISKLTGMHSSQVRRVVKGEAWAHLNLVEEAA